MTTRAIKRKRDDEPPPREFQPLAETAPSTLRAEEPTVARVVAMFALLSGAVGAFALLRSASGASALVGPGAGLFLLGVGACGLLYHAFLDKDIQYRRLYGAVGGLLLAAGAVFLLLPVDGMIGGLFLPAGVPCLGAALLFLLAFTRTETETALRLLTMRALGTAGGLMALVGFIGGVMNDSFLLGQGIILLLLGLFYVAAYIGLQPAASDRGYWAGIGLGVLGSLMMLIPVTRLFLPGWLDWVRWTPGQPGPPFLFFYAGIEYLLLSLAICSDSKLVVMTRRELATFFYSPIAYIVMVAIAVLCWVSFAYFATIIARLSALPRPVLFEPIVLHMIFSLLPVLAVICTVPIVTMRLLSEEQRSGTMEVLLTAPVNEWLVVLSKFFAALRFFLLTWYPWVLYLVALRVEGGEEFDYRPLLSFAIVFLITGAHFLAMGLFFSGVTRNQIASAILTLMGMLLLTAVYLFKGSLPQEGAWSTVLTYISYLDLWSEALQGNLIPRFLLFHLSATVLWLFLTVKVLEARKWR